MRQRISEKKLRKCRLVTGKPYTSGWARGGWPVGYFDCWYDLPENDPLLCYNSDMVNPKTGDWYPKHRDGQYVPRDREPTELETALAALNPDDFKPWIG